MKLSEIANLNFVVENVEFSPGSRAASLHSSDGRTLRIELEGDCCSSSFFDNEAKLDLLLITTDKASLSVLWRNESNGYYDGWANLSLDGVGIDRYS